MPRVTSKPHKVVYYDPNKGRVRRIAYGYLDEALKQADYLAAHYGVMTDVVSEGKTVKVYYPKGMFTPEDFEDHEKQKYQETSY